MSIGVSDVVTDLCVEFLYLLVSREEERIVSLSIMSRLAVSVRLGIMLGM